MHNFFGTYYKIFFPENGGGLVVDEVQWIARPLGLVAICHSQNMQTQLD
jgi:hypothetical protein